MEDILGDIDNIDLEEQIANFISEEQTPQWFNEFKTTFERHEVRDVRNDVLVRKLPACYRVPLEQYTPKLWQFGLHNRDVLHPRNAKGNFSKRNSLTYLSLCA